MGKANTPSFIHELPLSIDTYESKQLAIRFDLLRQLYNTCLGECFKRYKKLQADNDFQTTLNQYRQTSKDDPSLKIIKKQLNNFTQDYGLSEYAINAFATSCKNASYLKDHLDGHTVQTISKRAFDAVNDWRFGRKGRPRFKGKNRGLRSISGKAHSCITFKDGKVKWKGLTFDVKYDHKDKYGVEAHALNAKIKYCRIVRRLIQGQYRYYLQLVLHGTPIIKANANDQQGKVGLDIGPSSIAMVSTDHQKAKLTAFCADIESLDKQIKAYQRQLARSLRLANPNNYQAHQKRIGEREVTVYKVKKGTRNWIKSNRYLALESELKALQRKLADKRKHSHNVLANDVLAMGNQIYTETLSYKAFQKLFGRAVGFRAPGMFIEILKRKAEKAGGQVHLINTRTAKLSQYCHINDTYQKKPLSQRVHDTGNDIVQRDLYSAFLATCMNADLTHVERRQALTTWPSIRSVLEHALFTLNQTASGQHRLTSFGLSQSQSRSHAKRPRILATIPA